MKRFPGIKWVTSLLFLECFPVCTYVLSIIPHQTHKDKGFHHLEVAHKGLKNSMLRHLQERSIWCFRCCPWWQGSLPLWSPMYRFHWLILLCRSTWRQLYKNRSSRKIVSRSLFSREYDFTKTFSLTENQFSERPIYIQFIPDLGVLPIIVSVEN